MERVTLPDGTQALVPPMNGYDPEAKQYIDPVQEGDWVKPDIDEAGIIEDGNSQYAHYEINYRVQNQQTGKWKTQKTTVAFNPYIHSSFNPFNDQFKAAYNRPNMVVVEMYVPYSAAQGDKAHPRAKDAPGFAQWKAGSVASQLKALGKPERQVLLSNFAKVNRVLTYSNVADLFDQMADGVKDKLTIPEEVMPPGLRDEMESRGYRIAPMRRYSVATRQFDWDALPNLNPTVVNHTSVSNLDGAKFHSERKAYYALKNAGELDKAERLARKYAAKPETQWLGKYLLAKYHADTKAAAETVKRIVKPSVIDELKAALDPSRPVVAFFPMASKESNSLNRLPLHYAKYLAKALHGRVERRFKKLPDANNTNARANERAQREFRFKTSDIDLSDNPQIVIVDDVWTSGQTVASAIDAILAQHPEADIRAVTTLAVSRYGKTLKPTQERLTSVLKKSTFADAAALERQLGYDIRHATDSELQAYILHGKPGASGIAERFGEREGTVGNRAGSGDRPGAGRVGRDLREVPGTRAVAGRETPEARASVTRGPDRRREYLAAYLAAKILAGAKPDVELADKTARAMRIPGDSAGRDALESAQRIAAARRASAQNAVDAKDPNLMRDLMSAAVADRVQTAFQTVFAGGARGADPEAGREVERAIQRAKARDLATANGFTAAELAAELPVSLVDAIFAVDDYLP